MVDFLYPFVNDRAAPGINHLWSEDSGLVSERPWRRLIATCFGKEDWNRVTFRHEPEEINVHH
jgi:hypothetical protein